MNSKIRDNAIIGLSFLTVLTAVIVGHRDTVQAKALIDVATAPQRVAKIGLAATGGFTRGPSSAVHTVVVFSDFQCPYCRHFATTIDEFLRSHPDVRVIERNLPLSSIHPRALMAAFAAECANAIGRYAAMREAMFTQTAAVDSGAWGSLAKTAGISDSTALLDCMRSGRFKHRIDEDLDAAEKLGLTGTPSVIVDDWLLPWTPTRDRLESALKLARKD